MEQVFSTTKAITTNGEQVCSNNFSRPTAQPAAWHMLDKARTIQIQAYI